MPKTHKLLDEGLQKKIEMFLVGLTETKLSQISSNIRWGHRSRAKNGKIHAYKAFAYEITKDKKYVINDREAETVKTVFKLKLDGVGNIDILRYLQVNNFITSLGKKFTNNAQVTNILKDEKYIGRVTYGKSYTKVDGLEKKVVINKGEHPKYIINNHHEAIINIDTYNAVQTMYEKNKHKNIT